MPIEQEFQALLAKAAADIGDDSCTVRFRALAEEMADLKRNEKTLRLTVPAARQFFRIPGVRSGPSLEDFYFPDSARRPYRYRGKIKPATDATSIRAHIVNACIRREHITKEMCFATQGEFNRMIEDLTTCGLISFRVEDNITYYDSTSGFYLSRVDSAILQIISSKYLIANCRPTNILQNLCNREN